MVFGKNSPLKGETAQCLLTHGAVSKQKLWLVAIRVVAEDVLLTPKPKIMERLMFSFHKLLMLPTALQPTSYRVPLYFLEISKSNTHLCFI